MRTRILTLIIYEALWFAVVIAAARDHGWTATGLAAAFTLWQLAAAADQWRLALRLVLLAVLLGAAVDGGATMLGLVTYAGALPAPWPGGPPAWILGLWASFASTMPTALRWLGGRPVWAALLGAIGGPVSYAGAARGWHTVQFADPAWHGYAWLAVSWAVALAVLAVTLGSDRPAAPAGRRPAP